MKGIVMPHAIKTNWMLIGLLAMLILCEGCLQIPVRCLFAGRYCCPSLDQEALKKDMDRFEDMLILIISKHRTKSSRASGFDTNVRLLVIRGYRVRYNLCSELHRWLAG
jgi:hypothetical protein